jgi:dihydroneopterin aldolase
VSNIISVNGINCYAFHGCMEEEQLIGNNYVVDVEITTDFNEAAATDDLSKTVDYVRIYEIVKQQMEIRSKLIEHVAGRICDQLLKNISRIENISVKVTKLNPPIKGDVQEVSVEITKNP